MQGIALKSLTCDIPMATFLVDNFAFFGNTICTVEIVASRVAPAMTVSWDAQEMIQRIEVAFELTWHLPCDSLLPGIMYAICRTLAYPTKNNLVP